VGVGGCWGGEVEGGRAIVRSQVRKKPCCGDAIIRREVSGRTVGGDSLE